MVSFQLLACFLSMIDFTFQNAHLLVPPSELARGGKNRRGLTRARDSLEVGRRASTRDIAGPLLNPRIFRYSRGSMVGEGNWPFDFDFLTENLGSKDSILFSNYFERGGSLFKGWKCNGWNAKLKEEARHVLRCRTLPTIEFFLLCPSIE